MIAFIEQAMQHPEQFLQFGALGVLALVLLVGFAIVIGPFVALGVWSLKKLINAVTDNHASFADGVNRRLDNINDTLRDICTEQRNLWEHLITANGRVAHHKKEDDS